MEFVRDLGESARGRFDHEMCLERCKTWVFLFQTQKQSRLEKLRARCKTLWTLCLRSLRRPSSVLVVCKGALGPSTDSGPIKASKTLPGRTG